MPILVLFDKKRIYDIILENITGLIGGHFMKKPTSNDVAKLAGVSQATVSLILNGNEKITFSQDTKERVIAAAEELGYKLPNRKKREKNNTRMLLVFTPTLTNYYYSELVQYVEEYAEQQGYHVIVCNTFRRPELEKFYLDTLVTGNVAGIIYSFLPSFPNLIDQIAATVPAVVIGEKQEELGLCSISLNNVSAGAMLAEHLYQLGHRKIAFFSTPLDRFTMARSQRLEGVRRQMEAHGISDGVEVIVADRQEEDTGHLNGMPYEYSMGRQLTAKYLSGKCGATAMIGVNDMTALGILAELQSRGYSVPKDFSVCGFDNIFPAGLTTPELTTIEHHLKARCMAATDMLIDRENPSRMPMVNKIEYTPQLMIRGSTGICCAKDE